MRQVNKRRNMKGIIENIGLSKIMDDIASILGVSISDKRHKKSIKSRGLYALFGAIFMDSMFLLKETINVLSVICFDDFKKLLSVNFWESDPIYKLEVLVGSEEIKIERTSKTHESKRGQQIYNLLVGPTKRASKMGYYFSKIEEELYEAALAAY